MGITWMDYGNTCLSAPKKEDNLVRSTKRSKVDDVNKAPSTEGAHEHLQQPSYRDSLCGWQGTTRMDTDVTDDDSKASDDDLSDDEVEGPLFSMGITMQDKIIARKPWRTSLIIKLIGRKIGYQFLLRRLQSMWRIQSPFALIDLPNDFFIIRFTSKEEYSAALLSGDG